MSTNCRLTHISVAPLWQATTLGTLIDALNDNLLNCLVVDRFVPIILIAKQHHFVEVVIAGIQRLR